MTYSKEHIAAMGKAGWVLNPETGKFVKDEPAVMVNGNGEEIEASHRTLPPHTYEPKFHDNQQIREQPRQEPTTGATRNRNLYLELMREERAKQEEIARRQAAKSEMKFMGKDEARQFVNEEGLNSQLTLLEQHQLKKQMQLHQQKKQELQQQQQAALRTFGGARATLLKTVAEMSPTEKAELVSLLGLQVQGATNEG